MAVKECYPKFPYVIWDGSNMDEVLEYCAPVLYEGSNFHVTAQGDELHVDRFGQPFVLTPGMVMVGYGWPNVMIAEDFQNQYKVA